MDKNLAALMCKNTKTVHVRFWQSKEAYLENNPNSLELGTVRKDELSPKRYTYVTDLEVEVDDWLIVLVAGQPKVVLVEEVDNDLLIEPNDTTAYKWIVAKIDLSYYQKLVSRNEEITYIVASAYKKNLRQQFQGLLLAGTDSKVQERLQSLIENEGEKK